MNNFSLAILSTVLLGFLPTSPAPASEGNGGRGGGDVFLCKKGGLAGVFGARDARFVDTYDLVARSTYSALAQFKATTEEQGVREALDALRSLDAEAADALGKYYAGLEFRPDSQLEELADDIMTIPDGCQKAQLGIQELDLTERGVVRYHPDRLARLTLPERVFFKIHEAWIKYRHIQTHLPQLETAPVRQSVRGLADSGDFGLLVARLHCESSDIAYMSIGVGVGGRDISLSRGGGCIPGGFDRSASFELAERATKSSPRTKVSHEIALRCGPNGCSGLYAITFIRFKADGRAIDAQASIAISLADLPEPKRARAAANLWKAMHYTRSPGAYDPGPDWSLNFLLAASIDPSVDAEDQRDVLEGARDQLREIVESERN